MSVERQPTADSGPRVMTVEEYVERRCPIGLDYGDLVQQVADARDVTPLEAKEYISREGRNKAAREVRQ